MPDCPLADDCPNFSEQIAGMGCQHFGDRSGMDWCNHYGQPIEDLKTAPVVPGQEVEIEVTDMHESGAGVGHQAESGFVIMVDGVLPVARVKAEVTTVKSNYARADLIEKLPDEPEADEEGEDGAESESTDEEGDEQRRPKKKDNPRLGSRENFWGS
ncbi:putative RNA-binding protein, contains TRAM domain [Halanaeroarchaeum sp. HSR-CO]|uniref:TRAM domain-containing protein n=1 Tax=Halanaeroarchaeum sp. HSR-CO TaxID=2866382 RepID=UPI00217E8A0C|nr:TRAM domain-containing protein [Halanaeroarchaeum sp. HSR-CO]UWG46532.1 putative RNA-binding protein, contains TRAM domain [Halanaeroarchaeum sp. HSR-CO]